MNLHFYHCDVCGKVVTVLSETGIPTVCCGRAMTELLPCQTDVASEKHVPVYFTEGNAVMVRIGGVPHPMTGSHSIVWIGLRTARGFQFRELNPGDRPEASFLLCPGDRAEAVYSFCTLHGLWCSDREADA